MIVDYQGALVAFKIALSSRLSSDANLFHVVAVHSRQSPPMYDWISYSYISIFSLFSSSTFFMSLPRLPKGWKCHAGQIVDAEYVHPETSSPDASPILTARSSPSQPASSPLPLSMPSPGMSVLLQSSMHTSSRSPSLLPVAPRSTSVVRETSIPPIIVSDFSDINTPSPGLRMGVWGNTGPFQYIFPEDNHGVFYLFGKEVIVGSRLLGAVNMAQLSIVSNDYFNVQISVDDFISGDECCIQELGDDNGITIVYAHALERFLGQYPSIQPYVRRLLYIITQSFSPMELQCASCNANINIGNWGTAAQKHINDYHENEGECLLQCDIHKKLLFTLEQANAHIKCGTDKTRSTVFQYRTKTNSPGKPGARPSASHKQNRLDYRFGDNHEASFTVNIRQNKGIWARDILECAYPAVFVELQKSQYHRTYFTNRFNISHKPSGRSESLKKGVKIWTWMNTDKTKSFADELRVNLDTMWKTWDDFTGDRLGEAIFCHKCWLAINRPHTIRHSKATSNTAKTHSYGQDTAGDAVEIWECKRSAR